MSKTMDQDYKISKAVANFNAAEIERLKAELSYEKSRWAVGEINTLRARVEELEAQIQAEAFKTVTALEQIEKLDDTIYLYDNQLSDVHVDLAEAMEKRDTLKARGEELEAAVAYKPFSRRQLEKERDALRENLELAYDRNERLRAENEVLKGEYADAVEMRDELKDKIQRMSTLWLAETKALRAELEQQLRINKLTHEQLCLAYTEHADELEQIKGENMQVTKGIRISEVLAENARLKDEIETIRTQENLVIASLKTELAATKPVPVTIVVRVSTAYEVVEHRFTAGKLTASEMECG